MVSGYVYILRSLKNKRFYIGSTSNVFERFTQHKKGVVASTRNLRPLKLEFFQEYSDLDFAIKVERKLKSFKRRDFIEKIIKDGVIKSDSWGSSFPTTRQNAGCRNPDRSVGTVGRASRSQGV